MKRLNENTWTDSPIDVISNYLSYRYNSTFFDEDSRQVKHKREDKIIDITLEKKTELRVVIKENGYMTETYDCWDTASLEDLLELYEFIKRNR